MFAFISAFSDQEAFFLPVIQKIFSFVVLHVFLLLFHITFFKFFLLYRFPFCKSMFVQKKLYLYFILFFTALMGTEFFYRQIDTCLTSKI
jgi:hypothetical protein